jgi:hypothetical protein
MLRLTPRSLRRFAALAVCLTAPLLGSCAEQGEGERCDPKNDNQDCDGDLVCTTLRSLNRGTIGAICCPMSGCAEGSFDFEDETPAAPATPESTTSSDDSSSSDAG